MAERIDPHSINNFLISIMHLERYTLACNTLKGKVLDLGCGFGYGSKLLQTSCELVVAVDVSYEAIRYADENYDGPKYIVADGQNLPFKNEVFNNAVAFETIEHVEDYKKLLSEVYRVLKKDGNLLVSTPNIKSLDRKVEYLLFGRPARVLTPHHIKEFSPKEFIQAIESSGFKVTRGPLGQFLPFPLIGKLVRKNRLLSHLFVNMGRLFPYLSEIIVVEAKKDING